MLLLQRCPSLCILVGLLFSCTGLDYSELELQRNLYALALQPVVDSSDEVETIGQIVDYDWGTFQDNNNGSVNFTANTDYGGGVYTTDLIWMKCAQGQAYQAASNSCTGGGDTFAYCDTDNDSCDDGDVLNGSGNSAAFQSCAALNAGDGTHGINTWRVPTFDELLSLVECHELQLPSYPVPPTYCSSSDSPAISEIFAGTPAVNFRSATASDTASAFSINFDNGDIAPFVKTFAHYIRCVSDLP